MLGLPLAALLPAAAAGERILAPASAGGPDFQRYLLVCGGLVLAIGAVGYGFRKLFAGQLAGRAARRSLRIVDVLPLGGRQKLCVVSCYDRTFVLGLGEKEVALVAELDTEEIEASRALRQLAPREQRARRGEFDAVLANVRPETVRRARAAALSRLGRGAERMR